MHAPIVGAILPLNLEVILAVTVVVVNHAAVLVVEQRAVLLVDLEVHKLGRCVRSLVNLSLAVAVDRDGLGEIHGHTRQMHGDLGHRWVPLPLWKSPVHCPRPSTN